MRSTQLSPQRVCVSLQFTTHAPASHAWLTNLAAAATFATVSPAVFSCTQATRSVRGAPVCAPLIVRMPNGPIKTTGDSTVSVVLHTDVVATVTVSVVAES